MTPKTNWICRAVHPVTTRNVSFNSMFQQLAQVCWAVEAKTGQGKTRRIDRNSNFAQEGGVAPRHLIGAR